MQWLFAILLGQAPPTITVDRDNIEITESCAIQVGSRPIIDADHNGVIHITADEITIDFANQTLCGAAVDQSPDSFAGIGIKITGKRVTLQNAIVSGYKVGIHAINANGLTIHDCDVSNNFHQRLKSTPKAEDASDWLWPHNNDNNEWITNYGAGLCIEDSDAVVIHDIKTRKGQNGIILDRVNDSKVYDCDCSFLSGWGLAMWRSNRNVISRNAFDFCVRGYSHGVYNRGQDSAGILMFEQCCENVIAENSATHCGDGFFGFAGKEALGEVNPREDQDWYRERGCNKNILASNNFSHAAAHGLELTFSFDNVIDGNTFDGNAICGIWAGYSNRTVVQSNWFKRNGDMPYGLESGGINIEHGSNNRILDNGFMQNRCGVFFWWDNDSELLKLPWTQSNGAQSRDNMIAFNRFDGDEVSIRLRHSIDVRAFGNSNRKSLSKTDVDAHSTVDARETPVENFELPYLDLSGDNDNRPFARWPERSLNGGRERIIMTEWGPWDHESALLKLVQRFDHSDEYKLLCGVLPFDKDIHVEGQVSLDTIGHDRLFIRPLNDNALTPYSVAFKNWDGQPLHAHGLLTGGSWIVKTVKSACDPREDADRWRRESEQLHELSCDPLHLPFGSGGMTEARGPPVKLPQDHFGTISTRTLTFPAGTWRIRTTSDDGIRVWMDDQLVIDDWTWHAPKEHTHEFAIEKPRSINLRVEHFELDGYAILTLDIEEVEPN
ncbi:MAG: right-handed parallel beta-helix repeat-containing protein [Phycisphaerales bacterium]|nr:right-handed parallel beta-helix repeat-containing protein [Phycisphaerales bacterium]